MKVWITKYALTDGITEVELIAKHKVVDEIKYFCKNDSGNILTLDEKDFSWSLGEAQYKAEEMRRKKIESLKKQIEKLEEMRFE